LNVKVKEKKASSKRIKVLFIIDCLQHWAGTEKHLFKLVSRMDKQCYECFVCAFAASDEILRSFDRAGATTLLLPVERIYGLVALKRAVRLFRFIKRHDIDVVQLFHFASEIFGLLVARLARVPVVITSKRDTGFLNNRWHALALRLVDPLIDKTICVSQAAMKELAARKLLNPQKSMVIYNGVEIDEFQNCANGRWEEKRRLGLHPQAPVVMLVANLRPIKDFETFVDAAHQVSQAQPNTRFVVIGGEYMTDAGAAPSYQKKIKAQAEQLGLNGNLTFLGGRSDVPRLLSLSDICVLTSLSEGFSNTLLKYMAATKPVVATDAGGNREAVIDGETGFVVPLKSAGKVAEAIIKLLADQELAVRMGAAGRKRVEEFFLMEKMVHEFQSLYVKLLSKAHIRERQPTS
jgi:glycosyltransferase involved in cell wall biosynthesis